jgi:hypothetical protein
MSAASLSRAHSWRAPQDSVWSTTRSISTRTKRSTKPGRCASSHCFSTGRNCARTTSSMLGPLRAMALDRFAATVCSRVLTEAAAAAAAAGARSERSRSTGGPASWARRSSARKLISGVGDDGWSGRRLLPAVCQPLRLVSSRMVTDQVMAQVLSGRFAFGATIAVLDKDVSLGLAEAAALDVPMWGLEQAARLWRFAASQGHGGEDLTSLARIIEGWAGAAIRSRDS